MVTPRWKLLFFTFVALILMSAPFTLAAEPPLILEFEAAVPLPNFEINGRPAKAHTQGLYITERHYFVTGRLETTPRRALLFRFLRDDPTQVESLDITPPQSQTDAKEPPLDHPGGFDFDGHDFWIPVSASRPQSRSVILRVTSQPDQALVDAQVKSAFTSDDHIGALAYDRDAQELIGANWDTKQVYHWNRAGKVIERIEREKLISGQSNWGLAVQDWKGIGAGRILASGIDKSGARDSIQSRALVAIIDVKNRRLISQVRLNRPREAQHEVTNEGLARFEDRLLFLPDDLGSGAHLFRYRWRNTAQSGSK